MLTHMTTSMLVTLLTLDFIVLGIWIGGTLLIHGVVQPSLRRAFTGNPDRVHQLMLEIARRFSKAEYIFSGMVLTTSLIYLTSLPFPWLYSIPKVAMLGLKLMIASFALLSPGLFLPQMERFLPLIDLSQPSRTKERKAYVKYYRAYKLVEAAKVFLAALCVLFLVQFG